MSSWLPSWSTLPLWYVCTVQQITYLTPPQTALLPPELPDGHCPTALCMAVALSGKWVVLAMRMTVHAACAEAHSARSAGYEDHGLSS